MLFSFGSKRKKTLEKLAADPGTAFAIRDVIEDPAFAQAVAEAAGTDPKDRTMTLGRLSAITDLNASGRGIATLDGLELLNGLLTADFSDNNIFVLPDYTVTAPNLYQNRDKLVSVNLRGNPLLDPQRLFSLDASENRRKFFSQFQDAANRFDLGEAGEKVFGRTEPDPQLVRLAFDKLTPRRAGEDRQKRLDALMLKFIAGKQIFDGQELYKNQYFLDDGRAVFKKEALTPAFLDEAGQAAALEHIEEMLSEADLYLIRSLILKQQALTPEEAAEELAQAGGVMGQIVAFYEKNPGLLTDNYVRAGGGWQEKQTYSALRDSGMNSKEEATLAAISDEQIRHDYKRYLEYRSVMSTYAKEHPERTRPVAKMLKKADDFVNEFLTQYLALQNNTLLSDAQRARLSEAEASFKKYVDQFASDARAFFDQDIFGLEVEMKYIDMLAEADRKIQ